MPNIYSTIASQIFSTEFASDTEATTHSQISGWLSANVGGLNTLIHTNFSGEDPSIDNAAANILARQYMVNYYQRSSRNALRGVLNSSSNGDNILSVSDGDNRISFVNKKEVAREFNDIAKDLKSEIDTMVYSYQLYAATPSQVGGWNNFESGTYPYFTYSRFD
jgi:hypothetical protein